MQVRVGGGGGGSCGDGRHSLEAAEEDVWDGGGSSRSGLSGNEWRWQSSLEVAGEGVQARGGMGSLGWTWPGRCGSAARSGND